MVSCEALEWVGEPIAIGVAGASPAQRPQLIAVGGGRVGLAFQLSIDATLFSVAIDNAFDAWPPTTGAFDANYPFGPRFALSSGEPGEIAFTTTDTGLLNVLGGFEPGQNGSSFIDLPFSGTAMFLARSPTGAYLTGLGSSNESFLRTAWVSQRIAMPLVNEHGGIGCADAPLAADVANTGGETFWVANSSDMPLDDCIDADIPGPAVFANLWQAEPSAILPVASMSTAAPLDEIDLAANDQRLWVGMRDASFAYTLWRFDEVEEVELLQEPPLDAQHDIGLLGPDLIVARLVLSNGFSDGEVSLHLFGATGSRAVLRRTDVGTTSEPSLLVRDDQALLAWADNSGSLWVARAQCVR